jgi:hypothetical protein
MVSEATIDRPAGAADALIAHVKNELADRSWQVTVVINDQSLEVRLDNAAAGRSYLLTVPCVGEVSVWRHAR